MLLPLLCMLAAPPGDSASLAAALRPLPAAIRQAAERAYAANGWRPLWSEAGQPREVGTRLVRELAAARDRGLDPRRFGVSALQARLAAWDPSADSAARFDAALTAGVMAYARALDRGLIDPRTLHPALRLQRPPFDAAAVLATIAGAPDPVRVLRAMEPPFYQYRRLLSVLAGHRAMLADSTLGALPTWPRVVHPDSALPGAPALRRLLTVLGDLPRPAVPRAPEADTIYDATLQAAVRRFQQRHGLLPDGVLGPATRRALDRGPAERIRQVELTLERWRWLPREQAVAPIIVNIPAFRLDGLRALPEIESETLSMDVVVGTAVTHGTPLLAARLRTVIFQPWWNVPRSIALAEIRPKALADSTYLAREGFELRRDRTPIPVTPEAIAAIGEDVWVHQRPGPKNALGKVKFVMPNPEDIYLHDSPAQGLFARLRRDFSHGCIRVADPAALAAFVLRGVPGWSRERVEATLADTVSVGVTLPEPIPVFLVYHSVEVRESGETFFHPDVYGHDAELAAALARLR